jgi:NADPH:quinone reductase-like Zn-dependent oxidoreductase
MVHRARVGAGDHVVVTGGSGGVGSAAVQLAARRGARVTAIAGRDKAAEVQALGAGVVLDRDADVLEALGPESVDVVIDNVTGPGFGALVEVLGVGGRYASSGAIAGPMVTFDKRSFYLRDITLIGCTAWDEPVFPNLVGYIERGEIRPLVANVFPLAEIAAAQEEFLQKRHVGKLVLVPPPVDGEDA